MKAPGRVLFLATSANAEHGRGGRRRVVDVARQAQLSGFEAGLLCFLPFSQVLRGPRFWRRGKASLSEEARAPVRYFPMLPLTRLPLLSRLNSQWCALATWLVGRRAHATVFYGHGMLAADIALRVPGWLRKQRVVADFHGVGSAEYAYFNHASSADRFVKYLEERERYTLQSADQVIFVSENMRLFFEQRYGAVWRTSAVIPCAVNLDELKAPETAPRPAELPETNQRLVLGYVGSAVAYQLPELMCTLFSEVHRRLPQAFFLILSRQKEAFEGYLHAAGVDPADAAVVSLDHAEVMRALPAIDVGLLLRDDPVMSSTSSPVKFAEYLVSGVPVVLSPWAGDFSALAERDKLGIALDPHSPDCAERVTAFLQEVCANRQDYARRCSGYARARLSWESYRGTLAAILAGRPADTPLGDKDCVEESHAA